jgi:hypothetical protein
VTVKLRLCGEPDQITALLDHLATRFELAGAERAYPNRGSFGVRVYLEARRRTTPTDDRGEIQR